MSAYRSEMKQREVVEKKPKSWLSLFQNTTVRWVAAVGIALLVTLGIFLSTPSSGSTVLSGAAGQLSAIYPVVLLALIILGIILYIIFRRKK